MARFAVGVEYDGGGFAGWQSQVGIPTIQGEIEAALGSVLDHSVGVTGAGRTDTGVHARCQVAHFDTSTVRNARSLILGTNTGLPAGIALRWVQPVAEHFHARYAAVARTYRYCILNRPYRSPDTPEGRFVSAAWSRAMQQPPRCSSYA